jgi:phosphoglycerate dehydrogenase-like enzyme
MKVLITDFDFPNVELECEMFKQAGLTVVTAQCKTENDLIEAGKDADAFLVQYAPVNRQVFDALPKLKIVSRFGAGFDTINTRDAQACGVWVCNSPDYGIHEVSSHAFALALNLTRHLSFYDRDVRAGKWHYLSPGILKRPSSMTMGMLGLGRIGKRFAHIARETYGRMIAYDPHIMTYDFPPYVARVDLETLFKTADIVSIHSPLNDETRNLVNKDLLNLMKPGSYLVNTARGGVLNANDALDALNSGQLAGLALDVMPTEPPGNHPLVLHPRTVVTPHAAFFSREAEIELRSKAAQNIISFAKTGQPDYLVIQGTRS